MECSTSPLGKALVVSVRGRMDATGAPEFERKCEPLLGDGHPCLVLDLSGLEYVSSAGLRSFIAVGKKAKAKGVHLAFSGLTEMVREVFDISGMLGLFPVADTAEEAARGA